jgi:ribonuclease Z
MKIVLLGTGGYFPTNQRHTACMMLPEIGVVLDAGTGMSRMPKYLSTDRLDIFLTHAHLDHIAGLTYLVNTLPTDVLRHTTVHGEAAKLAAIRDHLFAELIFPVKPTFNFAPLAGPCPLSDGGTLTYFPLRHPGGSVGYRLDWPDRSMAYVTDTTAAADADYITAILGVDLLLHEAHFPQNVDSLPAITGHSWLESVAEVAAAANVGRLVLIHADPLIDHTAYNLTAAQSIFKNLEFGADAMELTF